MEGTEEQGPDQARAWGDGNIQFIVPLAPFDSERHAACNHSTTDVNDMAQGRCECLAFAGGASVWLLTCVGAEKVLSGERYGLRTG